MNDWMLFYCNTDWLIVKTNEQIVFYGSWIYIQLVTKDCVIDYSRLGRKFGKEISDRFMFAARFWYEGVCLALLERSNRNSCIPETEKPPVSNKQFLFILGIIFT